jgi:hypothetical protein
MYRERLQAVLQKRKCYGFGNVMVWEGLGFPNFLRQKFSTKILPRHVVHPNHTPLRRIRGRNKSSDVICVGLCVGLLKGVMGEFAGDGGWHTHNQIFGPLNSVHVVLVLRSS